MQATLKNLHTTTEAITAQGPALTTDLQTPAWLIDNLQMDVRLTVTAPIGGSPVFIGVGPAANVDAYLGGVAHDQITDLSNGGTPVYRTTPGSSTVAPPSDQTLWATTASGPGRQQLNWHPTDGRWTVKGGFRTHPNTAAAADGQARRTTSTGTSSQLNAPLSLSTP